MKILVTGTLGQVGHALQHALGGQHEVVAVDRAQFDLTNEQAIRSAVMQVRPDLIINPAAYTAVDKAESEPELAFAINAIAPRILAEEAAKIGAGLIHFSTDYVFDGSKLTPYVETDQVHPLSVYGHSKLMGELAIQSVGLPHLILRTSWVYGAHGNNFLKTILRLSAARDQLSIVNDQWGAPTSSHSIAAAVYELVVLWDTGNAQQSGVYHLTNTGSTSWFGFAKAILQAYEVNASQFQLPALKITSETIAAITTADYPTPAVRPKNSRLDNAKLHSIFGVALPSWEHALTDVMQQIKHFS
jgi:dTDP-4-dehydrorhamnose reductase